MTQAEGGEQGDSLMPLLFSIGIQGALGDVADVMRPDEQICAFLDDVYMVCQPERVRVLYDRLAESLIRVAGIHFHEGKTRVWNASGTVPTTLKSWVRTFGSPEESQFWAHPSVQLSTRRKRSKGGWQRSACCGRASQPCRIFTVRGKSSFRVPIQGATTPSALCHQPC